MFTGGAGRLRRLMITDDFSLDLNLTPSLGRVETKPIFLPVITGRSNYHLTPIFLSRLIFALVPAFNDQASNLGFCVLNLAF
jgi:hypothetical protein